MNETNSPSAGGDSSIHHRDADRNVAFRLFHLTIQVYVPVDSPLPITFNDWMERAGFEIPGSSPTLLVSVTELRHPLARDVIERRRRVEYGVRY